ncbi:MAG TPA: CAP domain-containing protein [Thermoleophilaceae bacterium]|nr:CAP domain-containing protein [Thermoleophilaceae bacterium]
MLAALFAIPADASAVVDDLPVEPPVDLAGVASSATPEATAAADPMVGKINRARRRHGLRPLRASGSLTRSSQRFGRYLMRTDRFGHDSHIWASGRFRLKGEVLAFHGGWRARRSATIRGWMRSPSHRSVLLSRRYRAIGAAPVRGRFGRRRATIWVAQVAR